MYFDSHILAFVTPEFEVVYLQIPHRYDRTLLRSGTKEVLRGKTLFPDLKLPYTSRRTMTLILQYIDNIALTLHGIKSGLLRARVLSIPIYHSIKESLTITFALLQALLDVIRVSRRPVQGSWEASMAVVRSELATLQSRLCEQAGSLNLLKWFVLFVCCASMFLRSLASSKTSALRRGMRKTRPAYSPS